MGMHNRTGQYAVFSFPCDPDIFLGLGVVVGRDVEVMNFNWTSNLFRVICLCKSSNQMDTANTKQHGNACLYLA